jgi:hypothetical protein
MAKPVKKIEKLDNIEEVIMTKFNMKATLDEVMEYLTEMKKEHSKDALSLHVRLDHRPYYASDHPINLIIVKLRMETDKEFKERKRLLNKQGL